MFGRHTKERKNPSARTIELIRENLDEIGLTLPFKESHLDELHAWFVSREIEIADLEEAGKEIDQDYAEGIMVAVDELQPEYDGIPLDLEYLNSHLQS